MRWTIRRILRLPLNNHELNNHELWWIESCKLALRGALNGLYWRASARFGNLQAVTGSSSVKPVDPLKSSFYIPGSMVRYGWTLGRS